LNYRSPKKEPERRSGAFRLHQSPGLNQISGSGDPNMHRTPPLLFTAVVLSGYQLYQFCRQRERTHGLGSAVQALSNQSSNPRRYVSPARIDCINCIKLFNSGGAGPPGESTREGRKRKRIKGGLKGSSPTPPQGLCQIAATGSVCI